MSESVLGSEAGQAVVTPPASGNSGGEVNSGGNSGTPSWRDSLPADIKDSPALKSFSDVGNLAKSYIHAQSKIGAKGVIVPGEKATDEEWGNFFKGIGVPEADKYEIQAPKDVNIDPKFMAAYKDIAAKSGLLPKQAAGLLEWYNKMQSEDATAISNSKTAEIEKRHGELKKEWGDAYDRELATANLGINEVGGPEFIDFVKKNGLTKDATIIKVFAKVGKLLGEDKLREGGAISSDANTISEIQSQLADLRANGNTNGLYDKTHPQHAVSLAKLESLAKKLTGGR